MRTAWFVLLAAISGLAAGLIIAELRKGSAAVSPSIGANVAARDLGTGRGPEENRDEPALIAAVDAALSDAEAANSIPDQLLLWHLLDSQPGKALALLEGKPITPLVRGIVSEWSRREPAKAVEVIQTVSDPALAELLGSGALAGSNFDELVWEQVLRSLPPTVSAKRFIADNVGAWVASDGDGALNFALNLPDSSRRAAAVTAAAEAWPATDIERALADWDDDGDPALKIFTGALLDHYSDVDPASSLRFMTQRKKLINISHFNHAATLLARDDPQLVLAIANETSPRRKQILTRAALSEWATQDPDAAVAYALEQPAGRGRMQLLQSAGMAFGRSDPAGALTWVQNLQPPSPELFAGVLMGYAEREPIAALEQVLAMEPSNYRTRAIGPTAYAASQKDPEGALNTVLAADAGLVTQQATSNLLQGWARSDPSAVRRWLRSNASRVPASAFTELSQQLAFSDPDSAAELLGVVPEVAQGPWLSAVARGYARQDPDAALAWLDSQRGRPGYTQANRQLIQSLAESDPRRAAQMVTAIEDPRQRGRATQGIAAAWGQSDPVAALGWVAQIPEAENRAGAVNSIVSMWSQQAPAQALAWARNQPDRTMRDIGIASYLQSLPYPTDSDARLLDEIADSGRKNQALAGLAMNSARQNPDLARRLLSQIEDDNIRNALAQRLGIP